MLKRTAFYDKHIKAGGKLVEFAGFELPIQYKGIISEVRQVRTKVGLFDVSHMGRIEVRGSRAIEFVSYLTVNDPARLEVFQAQYSCMCYPNGGIVDDIVVYRLPDKFLVVINGANRNKDLAWIRDSPLTHRMRTGVDIANVSDEIAQLAVQGASAESTLQPLVDIDLAKIKFYCGAYCKIAGIPAFISRTGYTGEDGFEIYFSANHTELWDKIVSQGAEPIGLGARDVLRLEMKYCLYGNDINETTTPLEAGLGWIVKFDKHSFIGKSALLEQKEAGVNRKLSAFIMARNVLPRQHYKIYRTRETASPILIGEVTSGNFSPSINRAIGLGYVNIPYDAVDTEIEIDCRGKLEPAKIVKPPFYTHGTRK